MRNIEIFESAEFGELRVVRGEDGQPWFVGKDVCDTLGYANASKALKDHVDEEDKLNNVSLSSLGQRGGWLINESGLYSLILQSKLPGAKRFKRWVTREVLPAIRRDGAYVAAAPDETPEQLMARALKAADEALRRRDAQIAEMAPKALFADAVAASDTSVLVGQLAKLIKQNGVDIGQNRLFAWMRDNGYLHKGGSQHNEPTQRSMEMGLFEVKERTINNPDGSVRITRTTKVTGKGQEYFVGKFLGGAL